MKKKRKVKVLGVLKILASYLPDTQLKQQCLHLEGGHAHKFFNLQEPLHIFSLAYCRIKNLSLQKYLYVLGPFTAAPILLCIKIYWNKNP